MQWWMRSNPDHRGTCFGAMAATEISVRLGLTLHWISEGNQKRLLCESRRLCVRFWLQRNLVLVHQRSHGWTNEPLRAGNMEKLKALKFIDRRRYPKEWEVAEKSSLTFWCDITWADLKGTSESRVFVSQVIWTGSSRPFKDYAPTVKPPRKNVHECYGFRR